MSAYNWGKGLAKGFFWGGLMGLITGILFTAKRDRGTWKDIGKSADALVDKAKEEMGQAQRKMEELVKREEDLCPGEKETLKKVETPQL